MVKSQIYETYVSLQEVALETFDNSLQFYM